MEDNSGFFQKEMIIGLAAGFVFFIILAILCCVGFGAMGKVCGDGSQAKNKVGPMDLRCCNEDAGDAEMQRKLSMSTNDDLESAADHFKTEDHTTVTCSTGQFTGIDPKSEVSVPRSRARGPRSHVKHHYDDEDSEESDQIEENNEASSNMRNPFRSRQGQGHGLLPPITRGPSARSSVGSSSIYTDSSDPTKPGSRLPPIGSNQQSTGSRSYNLKPAQGHSNSIDNNYNYRNGGDTAPRKHFKAVDLRF